MVIWFSVLFFILSCVTFRDGATNNPKFQRQASGRAFDDVKGKQVDCGGLCPCAVRSEVDPQDLEHWEVSGKEVFGHCPSWCHAPKDLGPRQWTWRTAEVNLWIQVFMSGYSAYQTYRMPRAVLKELQLAFAVLMWLASLSAAYWVHVRSVVPMLQYFFCALVTRALYMGAKYAVLASVVTACSMEQSSFRGCAEAAVKSAEIAKCLPANSCSQTLLEVHGCFALGADTCESLGDYMPSSRHGKEIFADDVLEMLFFLCGTVPIFMAATARESRHSDPSEIHSPVSPSSPAPQKAPEGPGPLLAPDIQEMLPGR